MLIFSLNNQVRPDGDIQIDPVKGNDSSINQLNTNMYVRLVNLTEDDQFHFVCIYLSSSLKIRTGMRLIQR